MLLALALVAYAETPFEGETLPSGLRTGWWPVSTETGRLIGETRYEEGVAVEGLGAPAERPRCLENPPPDGLYACEGCDTLLARPVAVVGGCVGATAGETWNHGVTVAGRDRFFVVDSDGERCLSGQTADYQASPEGLTVVLHTWTRCGGGSEREAEAVEVARIEAIGDGGAFGHPQEAVRAAALEALAAKQPDKEACEPLGRALRGTLGPEATQRALQVASAPCLADDLRIALFEHRQEAAAEALARVSEAPGPLATDLLAVIREGLPDATEPLRRRLFEMGPVDPSVRTALAAALVDEDATDATRRAAAATIDGLFAEGADGKALIAAADRRGSCAGWRLLMEARAVEASDVSAPGRVTKRCF